jgi:glycosyltransferase involved in cell wall biosynthesis
MKSEHPTITTIICTYRRPQMLRRAIECILNQTYQDFQICIYDNASGDETAAMVDEFAQKDSRIKYYCHPENIGAMKNYSYAIQQVDTAFFSFLADDDVILPNFYSVALAGFQQEPNAHFSTTSVLSLSLKGDKVGRTKFTSKILHAPDGVFEFVESGVNPNLHGTLMRREVVAECGNFMTYPWDDRDLLYRVAAAHPIVLSSEECLLFTIHGFEKGGGDFTIDHAWLLRETIAESLKPILSEKLFQKLQSIFNKEIQSDLYLLGIELIYKKDFTSARRGAKKLRDKYSLYVPSFVLELLVFVFKLFPFVLNLLISARPDLNQPNKGQKEEMLVLNYTQIIDIYNKKYK